MHSCFWIHSLSPEESKSKKTSLKKYQNFYLSQASTQHGVANGYDFLRQGLATQTADMSPMLHFKGPFHTLAKKKF